MAEPHSDPSTQPYRAESETPSRAKTTFPIKYLDTITAYNQWAEVYDTDSNPLQALDTLEMRTLLPRFLSNITSPVPWTLVDLGCGTGRNTALLLTVPEVRNGGKAVGLDPSIGMLEGAKKTLAKAQSTDSQPSVVLREYDLLHSSSLPSEAHAADGIISTLVVEHVPLDAFFTAVASILKPGGMLLLTNMHKEMGKVSQAGFVDPRTGEKVRPVSYAHSVGDVVREAEQRGFKIVGDVEERGVTAEMVESLGNRSRKWVGVKIWFGLLFRWKGNG